MVSPLFKAELAYMNALQRPICSPLGIVRLGLFTFSLTCLLQSRYPVQLVQLTKPFFVGHMVSQFYIHNATLKYGCLWVPICSPFGPLHHLLDLFASFMIMVWRDDRQVDLQPVQLQLLQKSVLYDTSCLMSYFLKKKIAFELIWSFWAFLQFWSSHEQQQRGL